MSTPQLNDPSRNWYITAEKVSTSTTGSDLTLDALANVNIFSGTGPTGSIYLNTNAWFDGSANLNFAFGRGTYENAVQTSTSSTTLALTSSDLFKTLPFNAASGKIILMPVAATCKIGSWIEINNFSTTSTVTIQDSAGSSVYTILYPSIAGTIGGSGVRMVAVSSAGQTGSGFATDWVCGQSGAAGPTGASNPNATGINIIDTSANQTFYPTFVTTDGTGQPLYIDKTAGPFTVNPNTGDLRLASTLKIDATNNNIGIGNNAGFAAQGLNAIAIGQNAGQTSQAANSIVINASGSVLNGGTGSAFYVAPIRNPNQSYDNFLNYDASTNEVVYNYFMLPVGGTTGRPSPAVIGMMRYNTTTGYPEFYNGTSWLLFSLGTQANLTVSAGLTSYVTIVYVNSANTVTASPVQGGFTIYIFQDTSGTAPGTTRTGTVTPNFAGSVEYLVVAGGAGGGGGDGSGSGGGGGGAGGYLSNYGGTGLSAFVTSYTLTVGAGGAGGNGASVGSSGSSSVFSAITAAGGGGGGNNFTAGVAGGSGGGGGLRANAAGGAGNTPSTTPSQGNNGGNALSTNAGGTGRGGGGGGSSTVGASGDVSANGGAGTSNLISGTATTYAAGGGGAGYNFNGGVGTVGVSGDGASQGQVSSSNGSPGTNGRGGGGGGAATFIAVATGGAGGSGIVIVRFPSYF